MVFVGLLMFTRLPSARPRPRFAGWSPGPVTAETNCPRLASYMVRLASYMVRLASTPLAEPASPPGPRGLGYLYGGAAIRFDTQRRGKSRTL